MAKVFHRRTPAFPLASYGRMQERSVGKDTTTGHWEIAGIILEKPFAVFERFPNDLVRAIEREAGVHFLGNYARSGTTILEELGAEHVRTGQPILYTSADSVLQIAAHEEVIPIQAALPDVRHCTRACRRRRASAASLRGHLRATMVSSDAPPVATIIR